MKCHSRPVMFGHLDAISIPPDPVPPTLPEGWPQPPPLEVPPRDPDPEPEVSPPIIEPPPPGNDPEVPPPTE